MSLPALLLSLAFAASDAPAEARVEADAALGRALVWAFEPNPEEIRLMAIEDLALLGDPRALDGLLLLVRHPRGRIQGTALRSISRFQTPRAEQILTEVVSSADFPEPLRLMAVDFLVYQRTPSAKAFLASVQKDFRYGYKFREGAQKALYTF